jgi:pimeloyl-ACP methyl ester carboxylesterase
MSLKLPDWFERFRVSTYGRKPPLILINGLAEQAETWYRNQHFWERSFEVYRPNLLLYEGEGLHRRIDQGLPITIDYLVDQLHRYLQEYVQTPPYHFVASSLGGKIAIEYAVRYPDQVRRMVLLCPSGMGDEEQLPIVEGVRRSDLQALVGSVFHDCRKADSRLVAYYRRQFANKRWRTGLLRTIRGTTHCSVRDRLPLVTQPTLLVSGREDRIVDAEEAARAARELPQGHFLMLDNCGHAPHIERHWLINRLVVHFLKHPRPSPKPPLTQLLLSPT